MPTDQYIIVQNVGAEKLDSEEEDEEEPPEETPLTLKDAIIGIKNVKRFLESDTDDHILNALQKQTITDFVQNFKFSKRNILFFHCCLRCMYVFFVKN